VGSLKEEIIWEGSSILAGEEPHLKESGSIDVDKKKADKMKGAVVILNSLVPLELIISSLLTGV